MGAEREHTAEIREVQDMVAFADRVMDIYEHFLCAKDPKVRELTREAIKTSLES